MGVNHLNFANGEELFDLRQDTVSEDTLLQGVTAHNSKGDPITGRMIPESGVAVQSDYEEDDPASISYIKNRPFYEGRAKSHFSSIETPNTIYFTDSLLGYYWHKVSDLMPTENEMLQTQITYKKGTSFQISLAPAEGNRAINEVGAAIFMFDFGGGQQFAYLFASKTGAFSSSYMGMPVSFTVPETGIYMAWDREVISGNEAQVDIEYNTLKRIDPKFLPAFGGLSVVEVNYISDDDNGTFLLDTDTASIISQKIASGEAFMLKVPFTILNNVVFVFLQHAVMGEFYGIMSSSLIMASFNANTNELQITNMQLQPAEVSTYAHRSTNYASFSDFIAMLVESAVERGLLKASE